MNILILTSSDFFLSNLWWIIAIVVLLAIAAFFLVDHLLAKRKKKTPKIKIATKSEYLEALGGADNILDKSVTGSRIAVKLKDYSLINEDKLKEVGVTGFIMMSDKLTLVFKGKAEDAFNVIFGNND